MSCNGHQAHVDDDGRVRVVIAHADPGVPNWLDTEGHATGSIFWRFFLAEERPGPIACSVVPLSDL
jgi:hypothetical protein